MQDRSGDMELSTTGAGISSFNDFQFTFNCSATSSGKNSFIEPDPDPELRDSESLTDSVQDFPEEFGRTYHAYQAGSYAFPNDELERERLELQADLLVKLFNDRLYFAPLSKRSPPRAILDIATGTGDWAIKMGDEFPNSEVVATDLSPIQPCQVPPNVNFFVEDSSQQWDYTQKFDYIHTRITGGCWSNFKEQIADQAFHALAPGGYFESQECDAFITSDDGSLHPDCALSKWFVNLRKAGEILQRPVVMSHTVRESYKQAGFVDIQERIFKMPINAWPLDERLKELGRMWERNWIAGLSGFSYWLFNRAFGMTPAQVEVVLIDVRRELLDTRIHAYCPVYVVTGRKPYPGEGPMRPVSLS